MRTKTVVVNRTTASVTTETTPRQVTLTLTLTGDGLGSVAVDPPGVDCTKTQAAEQTCTYQIAAGTPVTLTAKPTRSIFGGWGLQSCATATCEINLGQAIALTANFYVLK